MQAKNRPTIIDVARAADVGPSTVSRHVRGGKSVSPKVAKRIEIAIAALGYQPNAVARSLRIGRTQTLGLLFPHVNNVFYSHALRTIQTEARLSGFTVMLLTHQEDAKLQQEQLASLKRAQVEGVILLPAAETNVAQVLDLLGNTPVVTFDRALGKTIDSVVLDNYKAAREATEHLLSHGYSKILAVNSDYKLQPLQDRLQGYVEAMYSAGKRAQIIISKDARQLREELRSHLHPPGPSNAILSLSYSVTLAILSALQGIHFDLHDVGLIGIDDLEFSSFIDPPLTTLAQPAEELARRAVQQLLRRTAHSASQAAAGSVEKVAHVMLPGTLILRASCGCRPARAKEQAPPGRSESGRGPETRGKRARRRPRR
ncbi:MAG: LacI family DNA-binding transcriptional regulator [Acidobacteriota bacterium]